MNKLIRFIVIIAMSCLPAACSKKVDSKDSKGHAIRLKDFHGKWVIISYWATWCKPCMDEIPALNAIYLGDRKKVMVLGVSYDKLKPAQINKVGKELSIKYPLLSTFPLTKLGVDRIDVLPITFVFNPEGKRVAALRGPQTEEQFRQAILKEA